MLRQLRVWWHLLNSTGPAMRAGRQADQLFRFHLLKVLEDEGVFKFLQEPRTYGQVVAEFDFTDTEYTREMLDILVADKENILVKEANFYQLNGARPLPDLEGIISQIDRRFHAFILLAEGMADNVLPRLRHQTVEFTESFEADGREFLTKFDQVLGNRIYGIMRSAAFAFLPREDFQWLHGKHLLDVGCGSGRETAQIWLKMGGDIKLTGIDPVGSMLELAEKNLPVLLKELDPAHPPMTEANKPVFKEASATNLPFDDNTFDAAFWLFMLHWTPDPRKAISETVRVVKPGGLIFGAQAFKPEANPYFDLMIRTNENCNGFFWREDYRRWFAEYGLTIEMATPAGVFMVRT